MAKKIKVNIAGAAFTGKIVTFKAPCDCTEATGLLIGEDTYDVVDALGNCITGSYLAWRSGALVSVALDVDDKTATLQSSIVKTDESDLEVSGNLEVSGSSCFHDDVTVEGVLFTANEEHVYLHSGDIASYAAPPIAFGTADVTAGSASPYPEGTLYVVIE